MTEITITDVTDGTLQGEGSFDKLMSVASTHLKREYDAGRIDGNDYSTVYLGIVNSAMAQSIQFELQRAVQAAQVDLLVQQQLNAVKEGALIDEQIAKTISDTALTTQQRANLVAEALNIPKQGTVLTNQASKLVADTALVTQQKINAISEELRIDADTALTTQNRTNAVTQNLILTAQKSKIDSEKGLLDQKKVTEEAQTKDTAGGGNVAGTIGKQKLLYAAQTDGFKRDAEQKAAKIVSDAYAVRKSADATATTPAALIDTSISSVIDKMKQGIGIP